MLFQQLGVKPEDKLSLHHEFVWRATKRSCEIVFTNIWELTDTSLTTIGDEWKVIIDYPFDTEPHGPRDDIARIERYLRENDKLSRTIAWVPSFLSLQALRELGTLVKLDHILTGERFGSYVTHLSQVDQTAAKSLLENQQSQLRQRMIAYLEGVYGIAPYVPGSVNETHALTQAEHFQSLDQSLILQPAVGANLQEAFDHLLDQALKHQFPAHPQFEKETKLNIPALKRVYEVVLRATQAVDGRVIVEQPLRKESARSRKA